MVGRRSSILIIILVFAILFSLLATSNYSANVAQSQETRHLDALHVNGGWIYQTESPEDMCFELTDRIASEYSLLVNATRAADKIATVYPSVHDGRHEATSANFPQKEGIAAIKYLHFRLEKVDRWTYRDTFVYDNLDYGCGFGYQGKFYHLTFTLRDLISLKKEAWYVPIHLENNASVGQDSSVSIQTYYPFTNTVVWFNDLSSPITLVVVPQDSPSKRIERIVYADKPLDMQMDPIHHIPQGVDERTYHYQVKEHPNVQGEIQVKLTPDCMTKELAEKMFRQLDFEKADIYLHPSYIPHGYSASCTELLPSVDEGTVTALQLFSNGSAPPIVDDGPDQYSRPDPKLGYIILSVATANDSDYKQHARASHNFILSNEHNRIFEKFTLTEGQALSESTDIEGTSYITISAKDYSLALEGKLPLEELKKMTESIKGNN